MNPSSTAPSDAPQPGIGHAVVLITGIQAAGATTSPPTSHLVGSAFRFQGAVGTVNNVTIQNVIDDSNPGINLGFGVVAIGAGTNVTVSNSLFQNIGREGVRYDTFATGAVFGNTFTGNFNKNGTPANFCKVISGTGNCGDSIPGAPACTISMCPGLFPPSAGAPCTVVPIQ